MFITVVPCMFVISLNVPEKLMFQIFYLPKVNHGLEVKFSQ